MPNVVLRLKQGWLAFVFTLAAGVSLLLLARVDTIAWAPQKPLYLIAAWILVISSIGPLVELLDVPAQILLWNGTGWSIGLAVLGLESVGAMPLWPLMLASLGLTFWPRSPERSLPPTAIAIALIGGFLVCWLGWAEPDLSIPSSWLQE